MPIGRYTAGMDGSEVRPSGLWSVPSGRLQASVSPSRDDVRIEGQVPDGDAAAAAQGSSPRQARTAPVADWRAWTRPRSLCVMCRRRMVSGRDPGIGAPATKNVAETRFHRSAATSTRARWTRSSEPRHGRSRGSDPARLGRNKEQALPTSPTNAARSALRISAREPVPADGARIEMAACPGDASPPSCFRHQRVHCLTLETTDLRRGDASRERGRSQHRPSGIRQEPRSLHPAAPRPQSCS